MRVLTVTTLAALPRTRVLASSLQAQHPDWPLDVVVVGRDEVVRAAAEAEPSLRLRSASQELELDTERLIARHDEEDLSILLVPELLRRYARRTKGPVLHLPSSAWVLADLEPLRAELGAGGVLLVPRTTGDPPADGLEPTRRQLDRAGRISEATMAVQDSAEAEAFLTWWSGQLQRALGSLDGRRTGARPEDRHWLARYLELAPARFASAVLDDPGCNLSMWNLHAHELSAHVAGARVDGHWPLRLLDLPDFDPLHPHRLNVRATRVRVSRSPVLRELCCEYASELLRLGWRDLDRRADVGRRLANGLVYDEALRVLYSRALALGEDFGDIFGEPGSEAFIAWLQGPAPEGAAFGITRYVFYRVARERPDVLRTYPDVDGADGEEYVRWCRAFGREELNIPERFLPPRAGRPSGALPPDPSHAPAPTADESRRANAAAASDQRDLRNNGSSAAEGGGIAVRVTGYLGNTLGLGAAARAYVHALRAAAVPVSTVSVPLHHLAVPVALSADYARHGFEDLVHHGSHGFEVVAVNADELPDLVRRVGDGYFEGPRIGIWGWETNSIPARWERAFALVDEIWVYSRFMAENIGAVAPVPVVTLPPPVQVPSAAPAPLRLDVPEGFLFLFVFDYLSTIQRKNPVGLIDAFRRAFEPGEGPQLLIKTINAPLRPLADEEVLWAAHGRPDIHVVDRSLDTNELSGLMAGCDCYVSLHRAEGFGLTMAEAMSLGKPVIATGYSGNVDFMNAGNSYLVDYTLGRVGPDCEIYPPDGEWAEPDLAHAAQLMRIVYEAPEAAAELAAQAREDIARELSPESTGAAMRRRLEELSGVAAGSQQRPSPR